MGGKAVAQRVRMNGLVDAGTLGGSLQGVPDHFVSHRLLQVVVGAPAAGEQPILSLGLVLQRAPVLSQSFQEFGTEHDVAVFAPLAAADMNRHAGAVDVTDL